MNTTPETSAKGSNNLVFVIVGLSVAVVALIIFLIVSRNRANQPAEIIYQDYVQLEEAYTKAMEELEDASTKDYGSIDILKQNLQNVLAQIKADKKALDDRRKAGKYDLGDLDTSQKQNYQNMLEMSKQVADAVLAEKLEEMERKNQELEKQNQELLGRNDELEENITQMQEFIEEEKIKNVRLNDAIKEVSDQITKLETSGSAATQEIQKLKAAKDEYERRLDESNRTISSQNQQIDGFVKTLRKVSSNCYFIYEQGNKNAEARIYLTANGLSKQYFDYFSAKKPTVFIEFNINDELFKDGVEKVDMKISTAQGKEVYATSKTVSTGSLVVQVSGNLFSAGGYFVELKNGDEDLLIGDQYEFVFGTN